MGGSFPQNMNQMMIPNEMMQPMQQNFQPQGGMMMNPQEMEEQGNIGGSANSNDTVLELLAYYFSEENLNKDHFMRTNMDDNGNIDAMIIINFTK